MEAQWEHIQNIQCDIGNMTSKKVILKMLFPPQNETYCATEHLLKGHE